MHILWLFHHTLESTEMIKSRDCFVWKQLPFYNIVTNLGIGTPANWICKQISLLLCRRRQVKAPRKPK